MVEKPDQDNSSDAAGTYNLIEHLRDVKENMTKSFDDDAEQLRTTVLTTFTRIACSGKYLLDRGYTYEHGAHLFIYTKDVERRVWLEISLDCIYIRWSSMAVDTYAYLKGVLSLPPESSDLDIVHAIEIAFKAQEV